MKIIMTLGVINRDDLLAAGLLYGTNSCEVCEIVRKTPNKHEIEDPETMLVNVGKVLDPAYGNFDARHAGTTNRSAFVEIVEYLEMNELLSSYPWYKATQMMAENPRKLATYLKISKIHRELDSPFEQALVLMEPKTAVPLAWELLSQLIGYAKKVEKSIIDISSITIEGHQVLVNLTDCDDAARVFHVKEAPNSIGVINKDRTGSGWTIHKFNSRAPIDLSKADKKSVIHHQPDWFFIKTRKMSLDQAIEMFKECITKRVGA